MFFRVRCVHWGVVGFDSCSLSSLRGPPGVFGYIQERWMNSGHEGRRLHSGWLGSFGCTLGFVGFIRARPEDRRVHSDS